MAFNPARMTKIANLLTLDTPEPVTPGYFVYDGIADPIATITTPGYFDPYAALLVPDALIVAVGNNGSRICRVTAVAGGVVTFTAMLGAVS